MCHDYIVYLHSTRMWTQDKKNWKIDFHDIILSLETKKTIYTLKHFLIYPRKVNIAYLCYIFPAEVAGLLDCSEWRNFPYIHKHLILELLTILGTKVTGKSRQ